MKRKIAVPKNKIFDRLVANEKAVSERYDIHLIRTSEKRCSELLMNNRVDAALLSPLGYGLGYDKADYRIIPGPCLTSIGYSKFASIFFRGDLSSIDTIAAPDSDDFLIKVGLLMLSERYGMEPKVKKQHGELKDLLAKNEAAVVWGASGGEDRALDVCEEWFDWSDMPLPLGVWTCRALEHPKEIDKIVKYLAAAGERQERIDEPPSDEINTVPRFGALVWKWDPEIENALQQIIHFLYFRQYLGEISAVKVLGRDDEKKPDAEE